MTPSICANPACGALHEEEGIEHFDRDTGNEKQAPEIVLLCPICTRQVRESNHHRYERCDEGSR